MAIEPSKKISETPPVRREERASPHGKKKPDLRKKGDKEAPEKSGKVDIKI